MQWKWNPYGRASVGGEESIIVLFTLFTGGRQTKDRLLTSESPSVLPCEDLFRLGGAGVSSERSNLVVFCSREPYM
jgi:hypothetical protein